MKLHLLKFNVNKKRFREILLQSKVKRIAIFGSYAKEKQDDNSDVDFLVEFIDGADLLDQVGLKLELEELLAKKVDVVTPNSLSKYIRDKVIKEAVYL
jgi:predicted nucleotidyltransferase